MMYELFIIMPNGYNHSVLLEDVYLSNGFVCGTQIGELSPHSGSEFGNRIYDSCKSKDFMASGNVYLVEFTGELNKKY